MIPAWRAQATLARTLRSLLVDNRETIEKVIVVACPGDDSARVGEAFPEVDVVALTYRASAGRARNLGRVRAPDAELLLFVDADCALDSGAVRALIDALADGGMDAAGAAITGEGGGAAGWLRHLLEFKEAEPDVPSPAPVFLPSAALLVRAEAFDAVGGFPDMWPGEDLVFGYRMRANGRRFAKIGHALARHLHPPGVLTFLAHQRRLGTTSARARSMTDLPGRVFVGRAWLAPALLLGRATRALVWIVKYRPRELPRFAALSPLFLTGLAAWTIGFAAHRPRERPL